MKLKIIAIVAMDENRVIGVNNSIPWRLPEDMKRFAALTTGHTVLMGRKTYQSLPDKFRPLPKRLNVVLSRTGQLPEKPEAVQLWSSPGEFFKACRDESINLPSETVWVIGGEQIYRETMPFWSELYMTRIHSKYNGDAYFPEFERDFVLAEKEDRGTFSFERYVRKAPK